MNKAMEKLTNKSLSFLSFFSMFILVSVLLKKINSYFILLEILFFFFSLFKMRFKIGYNDIVIIHLKILLIVSYILLNSKGGIILFDIYLGILLVVCFVSEFLILKSVKVIFIKLLINVSSI